MSFGRLVQRRVKSLDSYVYVYVCRKAESRVPFWLCVYIVYVTILCCFMSCRLSPPLPPAPLPLPSQSHVSPESRVPCVPTRKLDETGNWNVETQATRSSLSWLGNAGSARQARVVTSVLTTTGGTALQAHKYRAGYKSNQLAQAEDCTRNAAQTPMRQAPLSERQSLSATRVSVQASPG